MTETIEGPSTLDAPLTQDNPLLSRPTNGVSEALQDDTPSPNDQSAEITVCAVDCKLALTSKVETYVQAGIAPATRRAYRADLDHFRRWGGTIPGTDGQLAAYLRAPEQ